MTPIGKSLRLKASRFAVTGLGATLIHIVVAAICLRGLGTGPMFANGLAFLVANTMSYLGNTIWSFQQSTTPHNFLRFVLVSALGLGLSVSIAGGASLVGLPDLVGLALVIVCLPPLTFLAHLFWTYKRAG